MELLKDHPRYDPSLELLCMLPIAPISVPMTLIARDLGVKVDTVFERVNTLRRRGYDITISQGGPGRGWCIQLDRCGAAIAIADGLSYFDEVYDDLPIAAA